eukprot:TRINITY_DN7496_c0_g1_i1.p1 TRINITY_DN7496_c0_g1~~TRINITY_DN7496_c0_g1_i1.p1  ORF type:complete len:102 (+),score=18.23 TRINITY_DN7496_c0_g1_i1:24-308(+)
MSEEDFKKALNYVSNSPKKDLSDKQKLEMYGLFKQISTGRCNTEAPGRLKFVERAKWQAWKDLGNMSKTEAIKRYLRIIDSIAPEWRKHSASKL